MGTRHEVHSILLPVEAGQVAVIPHALTGPSSHILTVHRLNSLYVEVIIEVTEFEEPRLAGNSTDLYAVPA